MYIHPPLIITFLFIILLPAEKCHLSSSPPSNSSDSATAITQFSLLNVVPLSFFITSSKSTIRHIQSSSFVILLGLLFSGDIQLNPGPTSSTFNICTLNIRSLLNLLKYTAIADLVQSRNIHFFALTGTWITPCATSAELFNATPPGFTLISCSRPASTTLTKSHIVSGGTAFLIREPATILSTPTHSFKSLEMSYVT